MKNFQKLAMGMLVAALAIGFSAFKEAKPFATTYYQVSPGMYSSNPGAGVTCRNTSSNPCTLIFDNNIEQESFNINDLEQIEEENEAVATPQGDNHLWQ